MNGLVRTALMAVGILVLLDLFRRYNTGKRKRKPRSSLHYTPRGDRVIVQQLARPAQAADQVFLPDSQQKPYNEGTLIAAGPDVCDLAPGDHVCFVDFAGTAVEIDGVEYLSMREVEIHGKRG